MTANKVPNEDIYLARYYLQPPSVIAIIGGIGINFSLFLPYLKRSTTISESIQYTAFDIGIIVFGPLILSSILAITGGVNLWFKLQMNPRICLIVSLVALLSAGVAILLQIESIKQEFGETLSLNYEMGSYVLGLSALLVLVATVLIFINQSHYNSLREFYSQQSK